MSIWILTIYLGAASVDLQVPNEQVCREAEAAAARGELVIELPHNMSAVATRATCTPPAEACDFDNPVG